MPNPFHVVKEREQVARETEKGRPLWLSEINKQVPAGANYDLESGIGAESSLLKTRAHAFLSNASEKNQTMREEPGLAQFRE